MRRAALVLPLVLASLSGCGGGANHESPDPSPLVRAHGVELRLEPGWHRARKDLTPRLVNPRGILSIGTFPMKPGGRCAQAPSRSYSAMGPWDGLITVLERRGDPGFPPRPGHFRLRPHPRPFECAPRDLDGEEFAFTDAGRHFYAFVALGSHGPLHQAESILDSFTASR